MASFTLASSKNFDDSTFSTRAGNDTYTIGSNYRLTIDTDTRYCANSDATKGNIARINIDYGEVYIDGTNVRLIPYNTGSGNVPAIGTTITEGGVSAYLLGVWSALNAAPTAAGAAMPASGYIKVKNKTGGNFSAGALSGIGASATGADVVGWIEVVGIEGQSMRDNSNANFGQWGKCTMRGAWFDVGTTSGSSATTYQLPASLANTYYPGVFVDELNNGNYRFWPAAGSAAANTLATDERAQVCWISSQGLLRFGSDGTNTGGMVPAAGLAIKVPNIVTVNATSAAMNVNAVPNATITTRYSVIATLGGTIDIDKANLNWYATNAGVWSVTNSGILDQSTHTACLTSMVFDNGGVGQSAALVLTPMNISGVVVPQTYTYWRVARSAFTATAQQCWNLLGVSGATLTNCRGQALGARFGSVNRALTAQNFMDSTVTGFEAIGCDPNFNVGMTSGVTITNTKYSDTISGTVGTTNPVYAITVGGNDVVVDGVSWLISTANTCQAYSGVVGVNTCDGVKVRNIGSMASPLDLGSTNGSANILDPGIGGGFSRNLTLQRIFCQNTRTGILGGGAAPGIVMDNVWGDTGDSIITNKRNGTLTRSNRGTINGSSGNAIGSHFYDNFTSTTAGQFSIFASEKTSDPNSAASVAITAGTPSMGGYAARMQTVGDQITWETPHWIRGHTGFANSAPSILVTTGLVAANLTVEFDLDKGSGFSGSWTTASAANLAAVSGINTTTGFKMRVRVTTATANTGTWSRMTFTTTTTSTDMQALHPLEQYTLTLTGLVSGSDVVVRSAGTATILSSVDANAGSTWGYVYETPVAVDIDVIKPGYVMVPLVRNYTPPAADSSLPVSQLADRNYS